MTALYIILGMIAFIVILLHFSVTVFLKVSSEGGVDIKVKYMLFTIYPRKKKKRNKKKAQEHDEPEGDDEFIDEDDTYSDDELAQRLEELDDEDLEFESDLDEELSDDENDDSVLLIDAGSDDKKDKKLTKAERKAAKKQAKAQKKAEKAKAKQAKKEASEKDSDKPEPKGKLAQIKEKFDYYKPLIPVGWKYFKKMIKTIRFYDLDISLYSAKNDAYESAMFYGKLQMIVNNALALICRMFTVKLGKVGINCGFNEDKLDYGVSTTVKVRPSAMIAIGVCVLIKYLMFRIKAKRKKATPEPEQINEEVKKSA